MPYDGQGTIYIPISALMAFLVPYLPCRGEPEVRYNLGNIRHQNDEEIEIDYAFSTTEVPPEDWSEPPLWLKK